ncbi:tRNA-splicing endonuclease subunit Sen2 [Diabrotica virgifera virgifera]|uniref:tRNA-splicing endonuclease subunit Sen2 n=1 Tax=Diabrotica virgifera virgifera TaxID=50390 RepID=A0ABM5IXS9_DIAVI|nr:tRNA-splicing endonuclease subunit Sen2 [Diabrotica virgifera virgifera]
MEHDSPRAQKNCKLSPGLEFPIIFTEDNEIYKIKATFNGFSVKIDETEDNKKVVGMGYFGKGNFSRSYPIFNNNGRHSILRDRQYQIRQYWGQANQSKETDVFVVPDSDDEYEKYFNELEPKCVKDTSGLEEVVFLGLEEAFFLSHCVEVLEISHNSCVLNSEKLWSLFTDTDLYFPYNYAVYNYFRAKNWVVKPGIKFGGDFVLYKQGPMFYHASYVVVVDVLNNKLQRIQELCRRPLENTSLLCLNRLCQTAGKQLMVCQLKLDESNCISYDNLRNVTIKEILFKRKTNHDC